MTKKRKLRTVSLENMIDKNVGKPGTKGRDAFEQELKLELLEYSTKKAQFHKNLPKQ